MSKSPHNRRIRLNVEELEARELPSSTLPNTVIDGGAFATDRVLVRWLDTPSSTTLPAGSTAIGNNTYDVKLPTGVSVSQAVDYFSHTAGVDFAQPDYIMQAAGVPNDPSFSSQWALNAISAPSAWNVTTGGNRIIVAEIDTGVDYNDKDLAPNVIAGWNFVNNTSNAMDDNGHGTHVAGIIGALGNNGTGVAGVDWNVEIMPLKFQDASGQGYLSNAVAAMNYAVAHGAKIINESWSGGGYDSAMASAIQNAQNNGVIVVAAAGNSGTNIDVTPAYPGSYHAPNFISVAATDSSGKLASFSNFGPNTVQIAAPGVSILSTTPNNTYSYYSGTSMAAPYVSGALALVWSIHPDWSYDKVIADVLTNVDKLSSLNGKVGTGGLLDLAKAVGAATPTTPSPPATPAPTTNGTATFSSGTVNLPAAPMQTISSSITINQHISISDLKVTVNLTDTHDSAVNVQLVGPNGQTIALFNHRGGNGQNLTNTTFDDSSPNAIYAAAAPFSGTVRPEIALSTFKNTDAFGTWKLVITVITKTDSATLVNWSMAVSGAMAATTPTTPAPTTPAMPSQPTTSGAATFSSGTVNLPAVGLQTVSSSITVNQHISINDLKVTVNLTDTHDSAVNVQLVGPNGQTIALFNHRGGNGQNLTNTTFDDSSTNAIYAAAAPFSGTVRPEIALSTFKNTDAFGTWKLVVTVISKTDSATLVNWSMAVSSSTVSKASVDEAPETSEEIAPTIAITRPTGEATAAPSAVTSPTPPPVGWVFANSSPTPFGVANEQPQSRSQNAPPRSSDSVSIAPIAPTPSKLYLTGDSDNGDADSKSDFEKLLGSLFIKV